MKLQDRTFSEILHEISNESQQFQLQFSNYAADLAKNFHSAVSSQFKQMLLYFHHG